MEIFYNSGIQTNTHSIKGCHAGIRIMGHFLLSRNYANFHHHQMVSVGKFDSNWYFTIEL